jgi:hypothetical protein
MSCILYSKGSYNALAKNPLFRHICQRDRNLVPEEVADSWYNLNVQAYNRRYSEAIDPVANALAGVDFEFKDKLTGKFSDLYFLMGRIDYQLSDGEFEGEHARPRDRNAYRDFLAFKEHIAHKTIERLGPLEPVQIPNNAISLMDMIQTGKGKR